jgi:hypothetical protein
MCVKLVATALAKQSDRAAFDQNVRFLEQKRLGKKLFTRLNSQVWKHRSQANSRSVRKDLDQQLPRIALLKRGITVVRKS